MLHRNCTRYWFIHIILGRKSGGKASSRETERQREGREREKKEEEEKNRQRETDRQTEISFDLFSFECKRLEERCR